MYSVTVILYVYVASLFNSILLEYFVTGRLFITSIYSMLKKM